jgi:hypothetical protein
VSGELGAWVGKNPKGKWRLQVVDTKAGPGGSDGQLNAWGISVKTLSGGVVEVKGDLLVDGGVTIGGAPMLKQWVASSDALKPGEFIEVDTKTGSPDVTASVWYASGAVWLPIPVGPATPGCLDCGDGRDGPFVATVNAVIDSDRQFTSFSIPNGVTVQIKKAVTIRVLGPAIVEGEMKVVNPGSGGYCWIKQDKSLVAANASGVGAGGSGDCSASLAANWTGGGGAGHASPGVAAQNATGAFGAGGNPYGSSPPETLELGSGGGFGTASNAKNTVNYKSYGGDGGGALKLVATTITVQGSIIADGSNGSSGYCASDTSWADGGGGSGGTVWLSANSVAIAGIVSAVGGKAGSSVNCSGGTAAAGSGAAGRIRIDALESAVVPTTPPYYLTANQALFLPALQLTQPKAGVARLQNKSPVAAKVRLVVIK